MGMSKGSRWQVLADIEFRRNKDGVWKSALDGKLKLALSVAGIYYQTHWFGYGTKANGGKPFERILIHPKDALQAERIMKGCR